MDLWFFKALESENNEEHQEHPGVPGVGFAGGRVRLGNIGPCG
jgi:hypothetical protein